MRNIVTQFYSSTLSFVLVNKLEKEAEQLFGADWQSEDDVEQINQLLKHIGRKDLVANCPEYLVAEEDIEVCEISFTFTIHDLKNLKYLITNKLVEDGVVKDCTDTDEEDEVNTENAIEEAFKTYLEFDYD
jgi:hypothetical protein